MVEGGPNAPFSPMNADRDFTPLKDKLGASFFED